ncbi:MAG: hypothetical protein LBR21_08680 [Propionibacteriaceae bacterium]|jgi:hypothetical protein|nr:hypothetical protein [Propionibacteriaceae bacterium]
MTSRLPRILSLLVTTAGAIMVVAGVAVYAAVANQLGSQDIKVAAVSADDPGPFAGSLVDNPVAALAQVNAISHHTAAFTGGKTYAELPNVSTKDGVTYSADLTAAQSTDGKAHIAGEVLSELDMKAYSARALAERSSLLQASLFMSVMAFGVSFFIAGMGLVVLAIGIVLRKLTSAVSTAPTH